MNENSEKALAKKHSVIAKICTELDHLYNYANGLIPSTITHNLGYKKELLKGIIEELIMIL